MKRARLLALATVLAAWLVVPGCVRVRTPERIDVRAPDVYYGGARSYRHAPPPRYVYEEDYVADDGVHVDAPGVDVHTGGGRTRVRAPGVDIDVGH